MHRSCSKYFVRVQWLCLALLTLAAPAAAQEAGTIRVHLTSAPQGGRVRLVLFDSASTFGRFSDPLRAVSFPAGLQDYELGDVAPGEYALVVQHDENSNDAFDKNFIGIPREPIAISRGYRPKGPPVYARARFALVAGQVVSFELELAPVLGPRGVLGLGAGVLGRSSPYVGGDAGVLQPIPAITYVGDDLQWFGPSLRYSLVGSDSLRLAATANYRLRTYDESDDPALAGLPGGQDTLMAGLALIAELPAGFDLALGYEHDVLDQIGGGGARLLATRSFQAGIVRFTPELAVNWTSSQIADNDFGVPSGAAQPGRPAYDVGDFLSLELGVGSFIELNRDWRIVFQLGAEFLPSEVTNSPIIEDSTVFKGFLALTYAF